MTGKVAQKIPSLAFAAIALFVLSKPASAATCDHACVVEQAKQFNANLLARATEKIQGAPHAQLRENTKAIAPGDRGRGLL
jgi:hypothetical protein